VRFDVASATSVAQVQELAGAAALRLSDGDLHALDAASN
jgi:aryl-alcohol dehydrogenase-like predicted oxidoreductase